MMPVSMVLELLAESTHNFHLRNKLQFFKTILVQAIITSFYCSLKIYFLSLRCKDTVTWAQTVHLHPSTEHNESVCWGRREPLFHDYFEHPRLWKDLKAVFYCSE